MSWGPGFSAITKSTWELEVTTALPNSLVLAFTPSPSPSSPPPFPLGPSLMEGRPLPLLAATLGCWSLVFFSWGCAEFIESIPRNLCPKSLPAILEMAWRQTDGRRRHTHHSRDSLSSLPQTDSDGHSELRSLAMPGMGDINTLGGQSVEVWNLSSKRSSEELKFCWQGCRFEGMRMK